MTEEQIKALATNYISIVRLDELPENTQINIEFCIRRLIEHTRKQEREACAEVATNYSLTFDDNVLNHGLRQTIKVILRDFSEQIATAIRARSE